MKIVTTVFLVFSTFSIMAMGPVGGSSFAQHGDTEANQRPDIRYQNLGLKAYKRGALKRALKNFKRSAKFGNNKSKYLTALVYLEQKEYVQSYAWLKLLDEPIDQSNILLNKFANALNEQEKASAVAQLSELQNKYAKKSSSKNNNKVAITPH